MPTAKFHDLSKDTPATAGVRSCHAKSQILREIPSLTFSCLDTTFPFWEKKQQTGLLGSSETSAYGSQDLVNFTKWHQLRGNHKFPPGLPKGCSPFVFVHRQLKEKQTHKGLGVQHPSLPSTFTCSTALGDPPCSSRICLECQRYSFDTFMERGNWARILHLTEHPNF